jgi:hypothetical protein
MFHLDGWPLMAHALTVLLALGLMSFACIGAFAKKQRLLSLGFLLLSFAGFLWAGWSTYPFLQSELYELSPFLSWWFVPLLNLLEAAGWGCVLVSVFKMRASTPK